MLRGKNAIVTGASGGIGKAIVYNFAKNGANIWACAHKKDMEFENYLCDIASKCNVMIEPLYFSLNNLNEVKDIAKSIIKEKKSIDILINNAGTVQYDTFNMLKIDTLINLYEINYFGQLQFTQLISRRMRNASIVFVSSIAGLDAVSGNIAYGGSKAAVAHAAKVLSKELARQEIRVNAVAPGMVDTSMKSKADEKVWNDLIAQTSLNRVARPEEIANVICFLASDLSSYVTGQIIRVDGGMH